MNSVDSPTHVAAVNGGTVRFDGYVTENMNESACGHHQIGSTERANHFSQLAERFHQVTTTSRLLWNMWSSHAADFDSCRLGWNVAMQDPWRRNAQGITILGNNWDKLMSGSCGAGIRDSAS